MNDQQRRWQLDGKRAFEWIADLYAQVQTARDDAQALFEEDEWTVKFREGWGGDATTTKLADWPFLFLTAFCALPNGMKGTEEAGTAAFFGFSFHDGKRDGPHCFAGRVRWSNAAAELDHWLMYYALGGEGRHRDQFERTGDGVRTAKPNERGRGWRPGVEEMTWFEVPLATVASADRLREIVAAAQALVRGDEAPAQSVLTAT